ncbi:MAG: enoyl-CoA hydratase-related protein [Halioglobus sp.]
MTDKVLAHNDDGVLVVTLNRAAKKNAIDNDMWVALRDIFNAARDDANVACVLLTGAGDNFSAGVDLASFNDGGDGGEGEVHPFEAGARALAEFDKPVVAAARGAAVGGGATCLFHCDIVYGGESLKLRLPFASLALVPEWASSYMLQANIGAQRAAELFYTAGWVDADKALELGIIAQVIAEHDLLEHAMNKAREIAQWPVNSLQEIKRCLRLPHMPAINAAFEAEQAAMGRQVMSADNIEALTAFMEKRPPNFRRG